MSNNQNDILLEVKDLRVHFKLDEGLLKAVNGVDFVVVKPCGDGGAWRNKAVIAFDGNRQRQKENGGK